MSRRRGALVATGALLAAAGLLLPADAVAGLDPDATLERSRQLALGASIFKGILVLAGALALGLALMGDARRRRLLAPAELWRPTPRREEEGGLWALPWLPPILLLGLALRSIGLDRDLWLDEVFTLVHYVRPAWGEILSDYFDDNQHLLYSLSAKLPVGILGESAVALRLPAVLFGVASLWAAARFTSLVAGRREAFFVTAFLALSYHHVWFSQNARGYTGLLLATVLSTELLLRGLWEGGWRWWGGYALVAAAGLGLHLTMAFVLAAHVLVTAALVVRHRGRGWGRPVLAMTVAALATLQLYALVLPQLVDFFARPQPDAYAAPPEWKTPLWTLLEAGRTLAAGSGAGLVAIVVAAVAGTIGTWSVWRRSATVLLLMLLPAALAGVAFVALERNLWPRLFFHSMAFAVLLVVEGLLLSGATLRGWLRESPKRLPEILAGAAVLLAAAGLPANYRYPKQDFSGARDFVRRRAAPGDRIAAVGLAAATFREYYDPGVEVARSAEELERLARSPGDAWVLYTLPEHLRAVEPELWRLLESRFEPARVFPGTLSGGDLVVMREAE